MSEKRLGLYLLVIYLFLALFLLPMFPHAGSANEMTRWATAASIVERGSFELSWTEPLIGSIADTAKVGNKYYSNKPPGIALLSVPFYAFTKLFVGEPNASNIRVSWFVMRFATSSLPLLLLGFWLWKRETNSFSLAILLFATPLFLYSTLFFSHVLVGVSLYFAFRLLFDEAEVAPKNLIIAGLLAGLAVLSEFPAIVAVVAFGIGLFFTNLKAKNLAYFIAGGIPAAVVLLIYNNALFGSPFSMSYQFESFGEWAKVAEKGFYGISFPSLENLFLILFSPSRGLFFYSPILLVAAYGLVTATNRKTPRYLVKCTIIAAAILFIGGHGAAHGGWAASARYLVFIIPFLLDSFFRNEVETPSLPLGLLFAVSLILSVTPALTYSFVPPEFNFPHNTFWKTLIFDEQWFTPTLLDLFVGNSILTIFPAVICFGLIVFLAAKFAKDSTKFLIGATAGIIICTVYFAYPIPDSFETTLRRATIAERYFKPENRLEILRKDAKDKQNWQNLAKIDAADWYISDATANAPNDFPYSNIKPAVESANKVVRRIPELQKSGKIAQAEELLRKSKEIYPFARCELSTNLAVIYYSTNRKDLALAELEQASTLVTKASTVFCSRSLFQLANLYKEMNQPEKASEKFKEFLDKTELSTDAEVKAMRQSSK
jgi:hypothetical protein